VTARLGRVHALASELGHPVPDTDLDDRTRRWRRSRRPCLPASGRWTRSGCCWHRTPTLACGCSSISSRIRSSSCDCNWKDRTPDRQRAPRASRRTCTSGTCSCAPTTRSASSMTGTGHDWVIPRPGWPDRLPGWWRSTTMTCPSGASRSSCPATPSSNPSIPRRVMPAFGSWPSTPIARARGPVVPWSTPASTRHASAAADASPSTRWCSCGPHTTSTSPWVSIAARTWTSCSPAAVAWGSATTWSRTRPALSSPRPGPRRRAVVRGRLGTVARPAPDLVMT
jgi:hypothetical protein